MRKESGNLNIQKASESKISEAHEPSISKNYNLTLNHVSFIFFQIASFRKTVINPSNMSWLSKKPLRL